MVRPVHMVHCIRIGHKRRKSFAQSLGRFPSCPVLGALVYVGIPSAKLYERHEPAISRPAALPRREKTNRVRALVALSGSGQNRLVLRELVSLVQKSPTCRHSEEGYRGQRKTVCVFIFQLI